MTAEIVIMNKMGVAMAADSAVTVAGKKVYNSANKLFMLSKYHPVGIMVYGNAEFMGFPWEVVIKLYRDVLGRKEFESIEEHSDHFFEFLSTCDYITSKDESSFASQMATPIYIEVVNRIRGAIGAIIQKNGEANDKDTAKVVDDEIAKIYAEIDQRDRFDGVTTQFESHLAKKYAKDFSELVKTVFDKLPISSAHQTKLKKVGAMAISRKVFEQESGVVLAGFGKKEIFPAMLSCEIKCRINGKLIRSKTQQASISTSVNNGNTAVIKPFAQGEMVHAFMEGIDPYLKRLEI